MTKLLEQAIAKVKNLSDSEQNAIALYMCSKVSESAMRSPLMQSMLAL